VHISYCTGEAGRQAAAASSAQNLLMESGAPPDDSTSRSPEGGGNKGKQQKSDIDVEEEQSKLAQERKRKARATEGDDRFSKKSKDEEGAESKKFDVSEDELGALFVRIKELVLRILTDVYREISSR
jgi:pre-mRNA-processing factor SLU7